MRLTDEQQLRYRQRLLAQWQDGLVAGYMAALGHMARDPNVNEQLITNMQDTIASWVTNHAADLPIEVYGSIEVVDA